MKNFLVQIAIVIVIAGAACGGGSPPKTPVAKRGPFAVATTLNANLPTATSLLFTAASLDAAALPDQTQAIAVADTVSLFGPDTAAGYFLATAANTPTISRYNVDATGTITAGPVLSLAQFGIGSGYSTRSVVFASLTKAYLFDDTSLQAITFDPSQMTIGKAIDLSALGNGVAPYITNFAYNVIVRGTQIVVVAYHYNAIYNDALNRTDVAFIDTTDDTVTTITDSRCGVFSTVAATTAGDVYMATDTYAVSINRAGGHTPDGCMLRIKANTNVFDPGYQIAIRDLTGNQPGGGIVPIDGSTFWLRIFDESLLPVTNTTSGNDLMKGAAWHWWRYDPASGIATQSADMPGAGEVKYFAASGRAYAGSSIANLQSSTLYDMSTLPTPTAGLAINGFPSGVVKTF